MYINQHFHTLVTIDPETGNRTVVQLENVYDMAKRRAKKELSYDKVNCCFIKIIEF